jgi:sulfate adenylyltransferase subunit 2
MAPARLAKTHLDDLESESIHAVREAAAQFERPVLLFSGGKDSAVLAWVARKACWPAPLPFPLLHIDTGHNFPETLSYRDEFAATMGARLIVRTVQDSIDAGRVVEEIAPRATRNALQSVTLLDAIAELGADAALGGGRRDEEKARAKERFFSHRDAFGRWEPRQQRPELWSLYNGRQHRGEHFRVFPLSNWTELDIWHYIARERIPLSSLYFAHQREVIARDGQLLAASPFLTPVEGDVRLVRAVRFRTVGDATCTGAVESAAATIDAVIQETASAHTTERGARVDDRRSDAAMEDRKRLGYF